MTLTFRQAYAMHVATRWWPHARRLTPRWWLAEDVVRLAMHNLKTYRRARKAEKEFLARH